VNRLYPGAGQVVQAAYVVDDIDEAMRQWQSVGGAGPFFVFRKIELEVTYRGAPANATLSIGLAQIGGVHVELIQQHSDGDSVYRDVYPEGSGGGFHHVAIVVPDVDKAVEYYTGRGFDVGMALNFGETPVAYIDTRAALGGMTEVLRGAPPIIELYAQVAEAAKDWDGTDPIRDL